MLTGFSRPIGNVEVESPAFRADMDSFMPRFVTMDETCLPYFELASKRYWTGGASLSFHLRNICPLLERAWPLSLGCLGHGICGISRKNRPPRDLPGIMLPFCDNCAKKSAKAAKNAPTKCLVSLGNLPGTNIQRIFLIWFIKTSICFQTWKGIFLEGIMLLIMLSFLPRMIP